MLFAFKYPLREDHHGIDRWSRIQKTKKNASIPSFYSISTSGHPSFTCHAIQELVTSRHPGQHF
jgi:hypothetical protein